MTKTGLALYIDGLFLAEVADMGPDSIETSQDLNLFVPYGQAPEIPNGAVSEASLRPLEDFGAVEVRFENPQVHLRGEPKVGPDIEIPIKLTFSRRSD